MRHQNSGLGSANDLDKVFGSEGEVVSKDPRVPDNPLRCRGSWVGTGLLRWDQEPVFLRATHPHFFRNSIHWSFVHPEDTCPASIPFTKTVGVTWTPRARWCLQAHFSSCVRPFPEFPERLPSAGISIARTAFLSSSDPSGVTSDRRSS
ncbi:unnamed protein product [Pseudo-nitzschia multistriata]|uniref:Uncharacterized protein n=1 Tax=Pseudo-nitzschia multistriata TaxID=183589 RepID=A0A448Z060_9STRA|nr:unnamed protein product [Pseudo-nitzschia multistriata]